MAWITNPQTGIATNTQTGATFQAANPLYSPPAPAPAPAPVYSTPAYSGGGGGGGGGSTVPIPVPVPTPAPTTWTNIITGATFTGNMPAGGSNAGWVPGTTAPAPGTTTPTPYPGSAIAPPLPSAPMPPGMIPDPSGAPMPLNPTPETITPFQENALEEAALPPIEPITPTAETPIDTAVDVTKPQEIGAIKKSDEMAQAEMRINNAYENYKKGGLNPNQIRISGSAGDDFIRQAAMAGKGRLPTPEELNQLRGGTTGGVLAAYGLTGRVVGSGESINPMLETTGKINWNPALNDKQKLEIIALVQNKKRTNWNQTDIDNYNFATGSSEKLTTTPTGANALPAQEISMPDPDNQDQMVIDIKTFGDKLTADLKVIQDRMTAVKTELADFQSSYALGQEKIGSQDIPLAFKAGQEASFAQQNAIKERNLISKLGIIQEEKAGVIDRANLQMQIDDKIYQRKRDIIAQARQYRQDQQEALATFLNLAKTSGIAKDSYDPKTLTWINKIAKDIGMDAEFIINALDTIYVDKLRDDISAAQKTAFNQELEIAKLNQGDYSLSIDSFTGEQIILNKKTGQITTPSYTTTTEVVGSGIVTDLTGQSYDITTYATDPNHENAIRNLISRIGRFKTTQDITNYIQQVAPNSPITGEMIKIASDKYGGNVSWEVMTAIMQQDSNLGTTGAGARSFNPGNVGNTEMATSTGQLVNFGNWQNGVDAVAKNLTGRRVSSGDITKPLSGVTQAIIDNPSLFDDLTPTEKTRTIRLLQANNYDTSNLGVKGLSDTAIKEIAQTQKALEDLNVLREKILNNIQYIGPLKGLQKFNPWSKSRQIQADIDRVRQTVGKALEGGVLRKEDEEKYKKILAEIIDVPATAIYKIDALVSTIQRDMEYYKSLQKTSGRSIDIGAPLQKKEIKILSDEELRIKYNY